MTKNSFLMMALLGSVSALTGCGNNNSGMSAPVINQGLVGPNGLALGTSALINCTAGQIRLQNVCRSEGNLVNACTNAGGTLQQNGAMCRFERRIATRMKQRRLSWGFGTSMLQLPAFAIRNGEKVRVYGRMTPSSAKNNDWQLTLLQNGQPVAQAQEGQIDGTSSVGGQFSMSAQPMTQTGVGVNGINGIYGGVNGINGAYGGVNGLNGVYGNGLYNNGLYNNGL
ncbi:MAG: hypothetical protein EOP09_11480, partial [Proteobacteria bacterium]